MVGATHPTYCRYRFNCVVSEHLNRGNLMPIRNRVAAISASALLAAGGAALTAAPAHAAYPSLELCNSSNSTGVIKVYSNLHPSGVFINEGHCNTFNNTGDTVRVDVDPEFPGDPDVGSFWWGYQGQGLDYCVSGEPTRWDSPNYYVGYVKINTDQSGC